MLSYAAAARCITATKQTLRDIRAEEEWSAIWAEAVSVAEKHNIPVTSDNSQGRPRRHQRLPQRFNDSIVDETTGRAILLNEYRVSTYYSTIDILLDEMITELNLSLLWKHY